MHSPRTQGARLELLAKLDNVYIVASDNPVEKYLKMEEYSRVLRSSSDDMQHINEPFLLRKSLNALPTEYDVQEQMLEDKEDGFSREVVMTTVRKRFESEAFKKLLPSRRNKKPLHGDQAFVADDA